MRKSSLFGTLRIALLAASAGALAACDGGGSAMGSTREVFIQIATPEVELAPGETAHLTATVTGGGQPEWRTSAPSVATVDASGNVTGLNDGEATVTAVYGKAASTATVRVKPRQIASVVVSPDAVILKAIGDSVQLSATAYDGNGKPVSAIPSFTTADTQIVSVSTAGRVKARGTGLARVVAAAGGKADTSMIQVVQFVTAVALSPAAVTLATGQAVSLQAVATDAGGAAVPGTGFAWTSSNPAVATVDAAGTVRSVAAGHVVVTATASSGVAAQSQVDVQAAQIATLAISPTSFSLAPGQTAQAVAVAKDAAGNLLTGRTVTWSSSNPAVANVSPLGVVFALADGSAAITATSEGKTATAPVTVKSASTGATTGSTPDLASADFENGTLGGFWYPWASAAPGDLRVVDDPTGGGRGKVMQVRYYRPTTAESIDQNRAALYTFSNGLRLGQTMFARGYVYIPRPAPGFDTNTTQRKLMYLLRNDYGVPAGNPSWHVVLYAWGNDLSVYMRNNGETIRVDGTRNDELAWNTWYALELQVTVNSTPTTPDGIVRVWQNGVLLFEKTDCLMLEGSQSYDYFSNIGFGYQVQAPTDVTYDEMRYWDKLAVSTKYIGP